MREKFWERYSLGELNKREWEALCDGCGQCCLMREVDDHQVTVFGVACELLDLNTARCKDYENRTRRVPQCHRLTPETVPQYDWLPETCAYRRVHFNQPLPEWHPLLSGCKREMRRRGIKASTHALPADQVPRRRMHRHIIARWRVRFE